MARHQRSLKGTLLLVKLNHRNLDSDWQDQRLYSWCDGSQFAWRRRVPKWDGDANVSADQGGAVILFIQVGCKVRLQNCSFEVIADKRPQLELALFFVAGNRRVEIGGIPTYRPQLPLAEPLGRRQVNVEKVRVRFGVGSPKQQILSANTPDVVRGQVPSVADVAKREALIERV